MVQEEQRVAAATVAALPVSFPVGREQNIPPPAPAPRGQPRRGRSGRLECATCTAREVPYNT